MLTVNVLLESEFRILRSECFEMGEKTWKNASGATGQRLEETKKINQSLSALGAWKNKVLDCCADKKLGDF